MTKSLKVAPEELRFVAYVNAAVVQGDYDEAIDLFMTGLKGLVETAGGLSGEDFRYHLSDPVSTLLRFKLRETENLANLGVSAIVSCNFCGKGESEVDLLIAGAGANICNACVGVCTEVIVSSSNGTQGSE